MALVRCLYIDTDVLHAPLSRSPRTDAKRLSVLSSGQTEPSRTSRALRTGMSTLTDVSETHAPLLMASSTGTVYGSSKRSVTPCHHHHQSLDIMRRGANQITWFTERRRAQHVGPPDDLRRHRVAVFAILYCQLEGPAMVGPGACSGNECDLEAARDHQ
jgi:hypothetical protein